VFSKNGVMARLVELEQLQGCSAVDQQFADLGKIQKSVQREGERATPTVVTDQGLYWRMDAAQRAAVASMCAQQQRDILPGQPEV